MTSFGVQPTGFSRKTLLDILGEIEADNVAAFGAGVINHAESPLGQLNGVFAEAAAKLWELAEDTYQSIDVDQAEGTRLDILGRLRLIERGAGETDVMLRPEITNVGRARIDMADLVRALKSQTGVTYVSASVNDTNATNADGISAHSIGVAVVGGDDAQIATTIRTYVVPGIGTAGNTRVDVNIDGFCRTLWFYRPALRRVTLSIAVATSADPGGCPAPTAVAMKTALADELLKALRNGSDITMHVLRTALSCRFPNVEIVSAQAAFYSMPLGALPLNVAFDEIATVSIADIVISVV